MLKYLRYNPPVVLKSNWGRWTKMYIRRIKTGAGSFFWNKVPGTGVSISVFILKQLLLDTQNHCAYCDKFPLFTSDKTIDHFKPKSLYPIWAYDWNNLFPACDNCQSAKKEKFSTLLLKPDEILYEFNKYFIVNFKNYCLEPNPLANRYDRRRAIFTIATLNLNDAAHQVIRRNELNRFDSIDMWPIDIDSFAYRYLYI